MNLNIKAQAENTYDAIVIGSGVSGGWAAKELTEKGLKVLMLDRGKPLEHVKDYETATKDPWEFKHRGRITVDQRETHPKLSRDYPYSEHNEKYWINDSESPYNEVKRFDWYRPDIVGGKSIMWGRQSYRLSDIDFEANLKDGIAVDWPIRYKDIAPWYSYVEKFVGISGNKDGLPHLPDGEFLPPLELTCVENYFKDFVKDNYTDRQVIYARCAHLTKPQQIHLDQGRGQCQNRTLCQRGCPFGGYFSSNSSTIPWAEKTGNLTLRPFSVVHSIIYDEQKGKATGVRVIDTNTKEMMEYYAKVIFVNAAAVNTNAVLLNSTSHRFPNGLGNDSGVLGKYFAFHNYRGHISGQYEGFKDSTTDGRRPTSAYLPRFRNVHKQETDFLRGYAAGFSAGRGSHTNTNGFGKSLKDQLFNSETGSWYVGSHMMGETIPKEISTVTLDSQKKDEWGIPQININVDYDDNDEKMLKDFFEQMTEMYTKAGFTNIQTSDSKQAPGLDIHEMGGVRMGKDPKTSMLNKWNQMHACNNVFVTDGACMTSTSTQNPSLTYMALTARAVDYAVQQLKKGEI